MNKNQKLVLIVVLSTIVAILLFPPFHLQSGDQTAVMNMGYSFIFSPPERNRLEATVDELMLLVQWVGILLIGRIAWMLTKLNDIPRRNGEHD